MTTSYADDIQSIRDGLRRRSGKSWSVTRHRGTSWAWLSITVPPARRVRALDNPEWHMPHAYLQNHRGACSDIPTYLDGPVERTGSISRIERDELAVLLDIPTHLIGLGGVTVSPKVRRDYVRRAQGLPA